MPEGFTELKYGETPWDDLSREELLREVQRMYAALVAAHSVMKLCAAGKTTGFWAPPEGGRGGGGGRSLAMAAMILDELYAKYNHEDIYRAFFRYAVDLLFSPEMGSRWTACDHCDHLIGACGWESLAGQPCPECARRGVQSVRRPLEWKDLRKRGEGEGHA